MSWEEFKQRLHDNQILLGLPKPDNLRSKLPVEGRKRIDRQNNRSIRNELRDHWMKTCSDELINGYRTELIAEQVGILAQRETDDFDQIIESCAESKGDRINMRIYISLLVFDESDLRRPWETEEP